MGFRFGLSLLFFVSVFAGSVRADAIDGEWGFTDGRKVSISGDMITMPNGHLIKGENGHHAFTYLPPGSTNPVVLDQLDEETMERHHGTASVETWKRRCELHTS